MTRLRDERCTVEAQFPQPITGVAAKVRWIPASMRRDGRAMRRAVLGVLRVFVPAAMVVAGLVAVLSSDRRAAQFWPVWAAIAVGLCVAAAVVWLYGLDRWRVIVAPSSVSGARVMVPVGAVGGVAILALIAPVSVGVADARGLTLSIVAVVGGIPVGATMVGIRAIAKTFEGGARGLRDNRNPAQVATDLVRLRRALQRLAGALGALVSLSTLALGAAITLRGTGPIETVIVFGAAGTFLVGMFYAPTVATLRVEVEHLADALFAEVRATSAEEVVQVLEKRATLDQLLGADRTVLADLQNAIPVLGPLIAGAAILLVR